MTQKNHSREKVESPLRDDLRYIVIEGVIGAGKTTLASMLATRFEARLQLEEFEQNPFLERFYADPDRWAFQTQMTFLAARFRQQKQLLDRDLFHQVVVSDYAFDKDRIFAQLTLKGDELWLYESLFGLMQPNIPTPDLIVYLHSTPERLLQNIRLRDRSIERNMDPGYIRALTEAYDQYFFKYKGSPLLIVDATDIDFVRHSEEFEALVRQIVTTGQETVRFDSSRAENVARNI